MTDATAVKGEVDHELTRDRPVERSGRAADDDRTEDIDFDIVVGHDGERSATRGDVFHAPGQDFCVGAEGFEPSLGTV
jgi:hypothetical protein